MFGWEFPPHNSGGLGVACFGLTRALVRDGLDLIFVLPKKIDVPSQNFKMVFADVDKGMKVAIVNSSLSPYITAEDYEVEGGIYGNNLFSEVKRYALSARKIAMRENFDVIHAHDWLSFLAGIEAKKISGKPLVVHVHATEFDRAGGFGNKFVHEIEKRGMSEADKVITVSKFTKDLVVEKYGVDPERIEVVHNAIEHSDYDLNSFVAQSIVKLKGKGYQIVLFAGRITLQKGPDYFIETAYRVLKYNPNILFVIVGSGDMEYQIMRRVAELGISDKVIFAGFLRGEELNSIYRASDLFILPSVSEPFGITPLESIINGTPVLISKQSGVSEVLSNALKVDFWDIDEMVNKILAVLNHESLKETLLKNSQEEVFEMSWRKPAKKCLEIYKNLVGMFKKN